MSHVVQFMTYVDPSDDDTNPFDSGWVEDYATFDTLDAANQFVTDSLSDPDMRSASLVK